MPERLILKTPNRGRAVCHPRPSEENIYTSTKVDLTIRRRLDEFNNEPSEPVDRVSV